MDSGRNGSDNIEDLVQRTYRFALSLTHDAVRAEDLVQETWLAVLKADGPANRSYLFAAVRSRFIEQFRRGRNVAARPLCDPARNQQDDRTQRCDGGSVSVDSNGALTVALGRLRPEERAVIYLADVEGYTARETADLLEVPRGTVLSMIHRAHKKLREILEPKMESRP